MYSLAETLSVTKMASNPVAFIPTEESTLDVLF